MPSTHIVVQALYPRGEDMEDNMFVWPSNFTYARSLLNAKYQAQLSFLCFVCDCGWVRVYRP